MEAFQSAGDVLFVLLGAIMVLAMHAGFAFLEVGTVRRKNQVNALVKIMVDFSVSTIAYFFVGYGIAYGIHFMQGADVLSVKNGYQLVKFFFLLTFAAAIPAIISGGIAERSKFNPQLAATFVLVGFVYPFFEGIVWNHHYGIQDWLKATFGYEFHDFAGSVVVHAMGGWIALGAVVLLGARYGRYGKDGPRCCGFAWSALWQVWQRWSFACVSTLEYPIFGLRCLDFNCWLVRLQRDVCADFIRSNRFGRAEFIDGTCWRHPGSLD